MQENRSKHFALIDEFRERMETALKVQESKLRKLSIEYDEELYPHLMSTIAEQVCILFVNSFSNSMCLNALYLLTRALLYLQVVDQPWSALGCHGNAGVLGGCGGLWEGCGVRHGEDEGLRLSSYRPIRA